MIFYFSDDDEFFDLPSDLPSDGELTPTNETINNGGSLSSTNISNSNGNGNLVEKALERLGPSMSVPNNFHYQIYLPILLSGSFHGYTLILIKFTSTFHD